MPHLKVEGGTLAYGVRGEGEPMIILRGLGRSMRHWLGFDIKLSKEFKVITMDPRGVGRSTAPAPWRMSVYDLADDVARVLDAVDVPAAHVMGVSLGGMIALAFGLRYPDRARSLSVINSSIAGCGTLRLSPRAIATLARGVVASRSLQRNLAPLLVSEGYEDLARLVAKWERIEAVEGVPRDAAAKQIIAALGFKVRADLGRIKTPTLVMYGEADRFVPPINSRMIHQSIAHSRLVALPGAGHEPTIDKASDVIAALMEFVQSTTATHVTVG